jgi:hypothetical protein
MEGQLQTLASEFAEARRQRSSGAGELNGRLAEIGERCTPSARRAAPPI